MTTSTGLFAAPTGAIAVANTHASNEAIVFDCYHTARYWTSTFRLPTDLTMQCLVLGRIAMRVSPKSRPANSVDALNKAIVAGGQHLIPAILDDVDGDIEFIAEDDIPLNTITVMSMYFKLADNTDIVEAIKQAHMALQAHWYRYAHQLTFRVRNFKITVSTRSEPDVIIAGYQRVSNRTDHVVINPGGRVHTYA